MRAMITYDENLDPLDPSEAFKPTSGAPKVAAEQAVEVAARREGAQNLLSDARVRYALISTPYNTSASAMHDRPVWVVRFDKVVSAANYPGGDGDWPLGRAEFIVDANTGQYISEYELVSGMANRNEVPAIPTYTLPPTPKPGSNT